MTRTSNRCRVLQSRRIGSWVAQPWRSSSRFSTVSSFNRLSKRLTPTNAQGWDYDAVGNWDSVTTNSTTQTRGANRQNEITSVSGAMTLTYDSNGNLTKDENDYRFVWDAWNMLVQVKNASNVVIVTMGRDALHRHVTDTVGTSVTDRLFSEATQLLETKAGSNTVTRNVWSPVYVDAMVTRDRDTDSNGTLDERLFALQDANWNTTALVTTSGTIVERETYNPFGVATYRDASGAALSGSSKDWVFLHQGGEKIAAGDYEFRNRVVSPTLGRWLPNDPIGFSAGDANFYRYVENGPENGLDPDGLQTLGQQKQAREKPDVYYIPIHFPVWTQTPKDQNKLLPEPIPLGPDFKPLPNRPNPPMPPTRPGQPPNPNPPRPVRPPANNPNPNPDDPNKPNPFDPNLPRLLDPNRRIDYLPEPEPGFYIPLGPSIGIRIGIGVPDPKDKNVDPPLFGIQIQKPIKNIIDLFR